MNTQVWIDIVYEGGVIENMFLGEVDMRQNLASIVDFARFRAYQMLETDNFKVSRLKYYTNDKLVELGSQHWAS
jgi:hypothetical protein